jgi:salicylate hydroxylase
MAEDPILIAGGGIAGLAAALGLARVGRECMVLERAARFEEAGAGIQLGPNAVKALIWLGAWDALCERTFAPRRILVRDGLSGRILQNIPLGSSFARRFGEPYRVAHRADLLGALLAAASELPRITLKTASEVTGCVADGSSVRVDCAAGQRYRTSVLIGADGIHSRIRSTVIDSDGPSRAGHILYRALIPVFGGISEDASESVCLWLCPGGHVVHYPVAGGAQLNIVAACEREPPPAVSGEAVKSDDVLSAFKRSCDGLRVVLALPNEWRRWVAADRAPGRGWSRGRVTLVGDAAHAALPYLAQGAAMALEDACALANAVATRNAGAFLLYERNRFARTARVQKASRRLARVYHADGSVRYARNAALLLLPAERFLDRMAWIYSYDPAAPD